MEAMVDMVATGMATVMVTVPMVMVTEQCWSMKMIVLVVVLCKPFVTMVSADVGLVMMPGMDYAGARLKISTGIIPCGLTETNLILNLS